MPTKTFEIEGRVYSEFEDGKLKLYSYINNEYLDIPHNWHTTDDLMELLQTLTIVDIADSMYEHNRLWMIEEKNAVHINDKPKFMALRQQLVDALAVIDAIDFITEEEYTERRQNWQTLTDEQLSELIAQAGVCLQNNCSEEKQKEFARALEKTLKEMNK